MWNKILTLKKDRSINVKLLAQSLVVGAIVGLVVGFFRYGIGQVSLLWLKAFQAAHDANWLLIPIFLGLCLTVVIVGFLVKQEPHVGGSGIPEVKLQLRGKLELTWYRILWRKLIGGIAIIGTGLFLGPEGPALQLGSTVGQGVGEKDPSKSNQRVLLATGAASGLAAAFGAPLAGALFVLEEVFHNFSSKVWLNALLGALTADYVVTNIFGQKHALELTYQHSFPTNYYWQLIVLGILIGLLGHFYKKFLFAGKDAFSHVPLPRWLHGLVPIIFLLPIMYYVPVVSGPGHNMIMSLPKMILTPSWGLATTLLGFLLLRFAYSIMCYDTGLPSGIFLPILTMGSLIGALFGVVCVELHLLPKELIINLIIFSMAGMFASIIRAPFTAIILITEMVGSLLHLMPLAVVAFFAILVDMALGGSPIYDLLANAMDTEKATNLSGQEDEVRIAIVDDSQLIDHTISEINWPKNTLVRVIVRGGLEVIPNGQTRIEPGDELILAVDHSQIGNVYDEMQALQKP
ncbi:MAG: ClC family H(+)/Cl(-) exchange transporter [Lactobacillus sp.]|nr:ClC family H(+)/Cl(-) exchange transporter [Lactobacillus sp.]